MQRVSGRWWVKALLCVVIGAVAWLVWPAEAADTPESASPGVAGVETGADGTGVAEGDAASGSTGDETAQAEVTEVDDDDERSTGRVVAMLWVLAAATMLMVIAFAVYTSPRRRARGSDRPMVV